VTSCHQHEFTTPSRSTFVDTCPHGVTCNMVHHSHDQVSGKYNTVTCIDVMIHYPTDKMQDMVSHLASLSEERLFVSFAPKVHPSFSQRPLFVTFLFVYRKMFRFFGLNSFHFIYSNTFFLLFLLSTVLCRRLSTRCSRKWASSFQALPKPPARTCTLNPRCARRSARQVSRSRAPR